MSVFVNSVIVSLLTVVVILIGTIVMAILWGPFVASLFMLAYYIRRVWNTLSGNWFERFVAYVTYRYGRWNDYWSVVRNRYRQKRKEIE